MGEFSIGQSVRRREDPRLLMGRGRYFDDLDLAHQLYATIVRSPHAHADIRGIDASAALAMPGVQAVLTGADYAADGLGPLPAMALYKRRDGRPMYVPERPAIAINRVRHVGYPVAVVVADTLDRARDAAEHVAVDYAVRPAVVSAREAFEPGAPQLYDDCPRNEAYFYEAGDKAAVEAAFAPPRTWSSSGWSSIVSPPIRLNPVVRPENMTPAPAATRCIAASSGHGCFAKPSPRTC